MNPPPPYPGTRSQGMAMPVLDDTSHRRFDRPGRLAPKWLDDFLSGNLQDAAPLFLDIGCASIDVRRALASAAGSSSYSTSTPPVVRHELLVKGHQCTKSAACPGSSTDDRVADDHVRAPGADGQEHDEIYSCMCQNCRYHFTFYIDRGGELPCGSKSGNYRDPYHHLVFKPLDEVPDIVNPKYYPLWGQSQYICSASQCDFKVAVEVSDPRLNQEFLSFLTDNERINQRLKAAKEAEPERYSDVAEAPPNALHYLRFYLNDIIRGNEEGANVDANKGKRISQRNKKFSVHFGDGPIATRLFEFLEFTEVVEGDNRLWKLPTPELMRPTQPGSQLAFYQDIKSEVESILGKDSENLKPNSAMDFITAALNIDKYLTAPWPVNTNGYAAIDYDILGIMSDMRESYFWWAFSCQRQVDPRKEPAFFGALQRLTQGRNNEELEIRVQSYDSMRTSQPLEVREEEEEIRRATEASLQEIGSVSPPPFTSGEDEAVARAYDYFGLAPGQRSDDEVLGKFESLCDSFSSQKSLYREKLLVISRKTGSKHLQERAVESLSLAEALDYLGVQADTEPEYTVNIAQYSINSQEKDYALVAAALRVIGVARSNNATLIQAASILMAGQDQSYQFGSALDNRMEISTILDDSQPASNLDLPVGLQNIRNTCYLNSILQYLFTVKPIREIVLNWQEYGLPISEETLGHRRIDPGSTRLEKGDAFAGQQFAFELSSLFRELLTSDKAALKPPQRLALAALKNPNQLEADGAKILAKDHPDLPLAAFDGASNNGRDSPAPPLPARHEQPPPVPPRNSQLTATVHVTSVSDVDGVETSSTRSSQTLVNLTDDVEDQAARGAVDDNTIKMTTTVVVDSAPNSAGTQDTTSSGIKIVFDPPPTRPVTVEEKIERALNDSSVTGTDQQDVEEVMGNIIGHLRAAVRATGEDKETGAQRDPVTDTFFWTSVTYGRSSDTKDFSRQVSPNRWVTAYPDENGAVISLLQALDNNFHRELINQGSARYERFTSIRKLPPILHVHIQRTTRDGGKNNTAIAIPQRLYLDRFMDSPLDSELHRRRRRAWNLQERIRSLKGPNGEAADPFFAPDALDKAAAYTDALVTDYIHGVPADAGDDGAMDTAADDGAESKDDHDFIIINPSVKELMDENGVELPSAAETFRAGDFEVLSTYDDAPNLSESTKTFLGESRVLDRDQIREAWSDADAIVGGNRLIACAAAEAERLQTELDGLFADMREQEYVLHAVICHAGQTGKSGHYWVWVFDFDRQLWRRYNDSVVTEEPDTANVMRQLSTQGEPYYLAYVRATDVGDMVDIPSRRGAAATPPSPTIETATTATKEAMMTPPLTPKRTSAADVDVVAPAPLGQLHAHGALSVVPELDEGTEDNADKMDTDTGNAAGAGAGAAAAATISTTATATASNTADAADTVITAAPEHADEMDEDTSVAAPAAAE